ncbi:GH25 family lysozyme [Latilactobacillus curvatus]|uniref:GH25 family lysozyme n=1 Tax=Latilactobacillus TaxID=2767885 RepID=UPI00084A1B3B|nr:GH25 family lysozyme [Latilactobacillus curvatus]AOO75845.1 endolysin [Latilactobacillus curvatus]QEA49374.1 LysM peptidoglycan-binding domain-containing protein [Latilactobacillus curvatus]WBY48425.1 GH25 family lysozyme [Latilactobacillus curvatus]WIE00409.1 GH25 family lysozyme [Latilactobacillus curvatus]
MTKLNRLAVTLMVAFLMLPIDIANAAIGDQGTDQAIYQTNNGKVGYNSDKFTLLQVGGYYTQSTYTGQVQASKQRGLRVHSYLWYGVGGSTELGIEAVDHFMPKIQANTPKGSIVALDYEDGASTNIQANTNAIIAGMDRIAAHGYTPMYYSYKPYTLAHVYYQQIIKKYPGSLWIAAYPNYLVTPTPNYSVFPSMDGVALYQFTSTYVAGGLDGNVDLTGITDNGYGKQPSQPNQPATGTVANQDYAQTGTFTANATVNVRSGLANNSSVVATYAPGDSLNYNHIYIVDGVVKGRYTSYSGQTRYASLGYIPGESFGARAATTTSRHYTIQYGDSFWSIANKLGVNMHTLVVKNGKSINSMIYPGQTLSY